MENKAEMKDTLGYIVTMAIVTINFLFLNQILTALVLLATFSYWVLKQWLMFKRHQREQKDWDRKQGLGKE